MMKDSMKWVVGLVGAVVLAGCGGSGDGRTPPPPPGPDRSVPTVVLGEQSAVTTTFITGQGRRAPGSLSAVIGHLQYQNSIDDVIPKLDQTVYPDMILGLDRYTVNSRTIAANVPSDQGSKLFREFPLEVFSLLQEDDFGNFNTITTSAPALLVEPPLNLQLRLFRGRYASVQMSLDDSILNFDFGLGQVIFDRTLFEDRNYDFRTGAITSFIGDYVAFDLSAANVDVRPLMSNGTPADMVLFSGDGIAMSQGFGFDGSFELLDPVRVEQGIIRPGTVIGGVKTAGIYSLLELDPRDLDGLLKITSIQGPWRPHKDVFKAVPPFAMVAFPSSDDNFEQRLVMWKQNADGDVTDMWQGVVRYEDAGSNAPSQGTFQLWPIGQIDDADPANEVQGTVNNLISNPNYETINGQRILTGYTVVKGEYNVTAQSAPWYFPNQGGFVVFRR